MIESRARSFQGDPVIGMQLRWMRAAGLPAMIAEVTDGITLDANHPLAGPPDLGSGLSK